MQTRMILSAAAGLGLAMSAAFAQTATAPATPAKPGAMMGWRHFDQADMAKHMTEMCENRYAGAVGHLATLEVKLNLTPKQKPLFDAWRDAVLSAAKSRVAECQNFKMPDEKLSIVDHVKMHEKRLQAQLAVLKAQMPTLEALNGALTDDQQATFKRDAAHLIMQGRMHMMDRMRQGGGMRTMIIRRQFRGDDGTPPPPPAE